jgi:hypothetical protein
MVMERHKGQAGMGGRGKNQPKTGEDKATRKRTRKTGGGATLTRPSDDPKANQGRNQSKWKTAKRMRSRY